MIETLLQLADNFQDTLSGGALKFGQQQWEQKRKNQFETEFGKRLEVGAGQEEDAPEDWCQELRECEDPLGVSGGCLGRTCYLVPLVAFWDALDCVPGSLQVPE